MPKSIVILNLLADKSDGAFDKLEQGLIEMNRSSGTQVEVIDAAEYVFNFKKGNIFHSDKKKVKTYLEEMSDVRMKLFNAKKIVISAHGTEKDSDHCFNKVTKGDVIFSHTQLVKFLKCFLLSGGNFNIDLMICYAARTANYAGPQLKDVRKHDIITSFAYKVFKGLKNSAPYKVSIVGRVGACGYVSGQKPAKKGRTVPDLFIGVESETTTSQRRLLPTLKDGYLVEKEKIEATLGKVAMNEMYSKFHPSYSMTEQSLQVIRADTMPEIQYKSYLLKKASWNDLRHTLQTTTKEKDLYGTLVYFDCPPGIMVMDMSNNRELYHGAI
ncbi:hypothetical protein [Pseudoalteromonas denitrificans]|uniref:Uncharacterized protein n=1 Tax=Pseudoalteromonas denitrificans DSM 6059 TaxID=1123010 RepID=A0A1I1MWQ5_9GAMM|nr:hypothetical protein [Pseudoalteromonas denitrificans]SFC89799.1 hypothetical protein SAMN02745724_02848 [Pseudoalteromonas denitrificans DSM 6059]